MNELLKGKIGNNKWSIFNELHQLFLSTNQKIDYRIFPLYIIYFLDDVVISVIYFKGKLVSNDSGDQLDVGFSFKNKPPIRNLISAEYMRYPGINYSLKFNSKSKISEDLVKMIKSSLLISNK